MTHDGHMPRERYEKDRSSITPSRMVEGRPRCQGRGEEDKSEYPHAGQDEAEGPEHTETRLRHSGSRRLVVAHCLIGPSNTKISCEGRHRE